MIIQHFLSTNFLLTDYAAIEGEKKSLRWLEKEQKGGRIVKQVEDETGRTILNTSEVEGHERHIKALRLISICHCHHISHSWCSCSCNYHNTLSIQRGSSCSLPGFRLSQLFFAVTPQLYKSGNKTYPSVNNWPWVGQKIRHWKTLCSVYIDQEVNWDHVMHLSKSWIHQFCFVSNTCFKHNMLPNLLERETI